MFLTISDNLILKIDLILSDNRTLTLKLLYYYLFGTCKKLAIMNA